MDPLLAQQRVLPRLERPHAVIAQPVGTAPHQHVAVRQREAVGRVLALQAPPHRNTAGRPSETDTMGAVRSRSSRSWCSDIRAAGR